MLRSLWRSRRLYTVLTIVVGGLVLAAVSIARHDPRTSRLDAEEASGISSDFPVQTDSRFDVFKYLPPSAIVRDQKRHVVFVDLDGDGKQEVVVFYALVTNTISQANIAVLKFSDGSYQTFWENRYDPSSGFVDPSGVYSFGKDQRPQIIAYRAVGASCPGVLDIYQYSNGAIERITGDWSGKCQSALEVRDLDGDGVPEIAFRDLKYGSNPHIYRWSGREYIRSDSEFPQYYGEELERLKGFVHSRNGFPTGARVSWCKQAVEIYLLQKRYPEAIRLCEAVLKIIDDPNLTVPNSVPTNNQSVEQLNRIQVSLELDRARGKADVYRLLGDIYKAAGDLRQSQEEYRISRGFEAEAAKKSALLLH